MSDVRCGYGTPAFTANLMGNLILENRERIERVWRELDREFMDGHFIRDAEDYYRRTRAFFPAGEGAVVAWEWERGTWWLDAWNEGGHFPGLHALQAFVKVCFAVGCETLYTCTEAHPTGIYRRAGWTHVGEDIWAIRYRLEDL